MHQLGSARAEAGSGLRRGRIEGRPTSPDALRCRCRRRRRPVTPAAASSPAATTTTPSPTTTSNTPDYDRIPALFASEDAFALPTYWDRRYEGAGEGEPEEWYRGDRDEAMRAVVAAHLDPQLPVLQLGVGTSRLQEAMAQGFVEQGEAEEEGVFDDNDDGCFQSVLSVDFSSVAIERQRQRHQALLLSQSQSDANTRQWASRLSYAQADVRSMPQLSDSSFGGGVLDKGALDALLCGDDADEAAGQCLGEAWRVLAPGAAYVMITSAAPAARRRLLPTATNATAQAPNPLPVWAGVLVYRLGQQGALAGPAPLDDAGAEAALLAAHEGDDRFRYSHYAYVCVKG